MSYNPIEYGVTPPDAILADGTVPMGADLDLGTNKIINVVDPTTDQEAATKKYVDDTVTGGAVADGDKGDITVSSTGTVWTIDNDVVTYAKMQNVSAVSKILGRGSAGGAGDPQEITLGTNLTMSGTTLDAAGGSYTDEQAQDAVGTILVDGTTIDFTYNDETPSITAERAALTGDVTASAGSNATTIANDAVTFAKFQNITTARLLGRATAGSGDMEEITLGTNLSYTGTTLNAAGGGSGALWGAGFALTPPVDGDFAWINQGGASVDTTNASSILLKATGVSAINLRVREKTVPSTPYTITTAFVGLMYPTTNNQYWGIGWKEAASGKLQTLNFTWDTDVEADPRLKVYSWTSPTVFSTTDLTVASAFPYAYRAQGGALAWMQMRDDGSNRTFWISNDGLYWKQVYTATHTFNFTPAKVFFFVGQSTGTDETATRLVHWVEA